MICSLAYDYYSALTETRVEHDHKQDFEEMASKMGINVRVANSNDAEELLRLNQKFNGGERRPPLEIIESMRKSNELIAIAEISGKIVIVL